MVSTVCSIASEAGSEDVLTVAKVTSDPPNHTDVTGDRSAQAGTGWLDLPFAHPICTPHLHTGHLHAGRYALWSPLDTGRQMSQLIYSTEELLDTDDVAEPLTANGILCHGGLDDDGNYISPRTRNRVPAIAAWQANHLKQFAGKELIDVRINDWPANFPTLEQTRMLLRRGAPESVVSSLTRIGTVEGFGSFLRFTEVPDLQSIIVEDIDGTALAHLDKGLIEAHARDEAGWEGDGVVEAGHRDMWFAARDIAFENPITEDQTQIMLERMGIVAPGGAPGPTAQPTRLLSDDISPQLDLLLQRMIRLLMIEISAFHTFTWAEALLSDDSLVAGNGEAAFIVNCIRADETPHVEYLRTALTELRDRTVIGESGKHHSGEEIVDTIWQVARTEATGVRRDNMIQTMEGEIKHSLEGRSDADDIWEEFRTLGESSD